MKKPLDFFHTFVARFPLPLSLCPSPQSPPLSRVHRHQPVPPPPDVRLRQPRQHPGPDPLPRERAHAAALSQHGGPGRRAHHVAVRADRGVPHGLHGDRVEDSREERGRGAWGSGGGGRCCCCCCCCRWCVFAAVAVFAAAARRCCRSRCRRCRSLRRGDLLGPPLRPIPSLEGGPGPGHPDDSAVVLVVVARVRVVARLLPLLCCCWFYCCWMWWCS